MLEEDENPETAVCWWLCPIARGGEGCPQPLSPHHPIPEPPGPGGLGCGRTTLLGKKMTPKFGHGHSQLARG